MSKIRRLVFGALATLASLMLTVSCTSSVTSQRPTNGADSVPNVVVSSATVQVGDAIGTRLTSGLVGLSIEPIILEQGLLTRYDYAPFLKALGSSGVVRIGGNFGDTAFWTSTGEQAPSWATGVLTPGDFTPLKSLLAATGWRAVVQVNLKHFDAARAADMAASVQQVLGAQLAGIEIGNEPNYYYKNPENLYTAEQAYASAIRRAAPGVALTGPDLGSNDLPYLRAFVALAHGSALSELTLHDYALSGCGSEARSRVSAAALLSAKLRSAALFSGSQLSEQAHIIDATPVVSEANSVNCGGVSGVSNSFVAALWSLEFGLSQAAGGVQRINFHTSGTQHCIGYAEICVDSEHLTATAPYAGLVTLGQVRPGAFRRVTTSSPAIWATAVQGTGKIQVVLVSTANSASGRQTNLTVSLGDSYRSCTQMALRPQGGELSATSGVTLGGASFARSVEVPRAQQLSSSVGSTVRTTMPALSALILTCSSGA